MKRQLGSLFLIWTILLAGSSSGSVTAQTISKDTIKDVNSSKIINESAKNSFEKTYNFSKTSALDAPVDFDKIKKDAIKTPSTRKMSAKRKAMWIAIWVGIAVGMFFVIKYAKECIEYASYCSPDEVCPCLKYKEEENDK